MYQCAFRFSAPVLLLVSLWLTPTASYRNRVMFTDVVTRAMEARHRQMCTGSHGSGEVEEYDNSGAPWAYSSALDNFAGPVLFGVVANDARDDAGTLQVRFAGAAPNVGEDHFAFPPDCLPRSTRSGFFVIGASVSPNSIVESCETLVTDSKRLGRAYAPSVRGGHARMFPGCPVRVSCSGVGGNRLLLLAPEPVSRDLWFEVSPSLRNVNFASLAKVDRLDDPSESLSQRAMQKSHGGAMAVYAPKNSAPRRVNPTWPPATVRGRRVGPWVGGLILPEG